MDFVDAFDKTYEKNEWQVALRKDMTCPFPDSETELRCFAEVRSEIKTSNQLKWDRFESAYLVGEASAKRFDGLLLLTCNPRTLNTLRYLILIATFLNELKLKTLSRLDDDISSRI